MTQPLDDADYGRGLSHLPIISLMAVEVRAAENCIGPCNAFVTELGVAGGVVTFCRALP